MCSCLFECPNVNRNYVIVSELPTKLGGIVCCFVDFFVMKQIVDFWNINKIAFIYIYICIIYNNKWYSIALSQWKVMYVKPNKTSLKNIERHTAHNNVSWPIPEWWQTSHTSDMMVIIRQTKCILTIIIREMGHLNIHSPIYCMKDNSENRHTLDRIYPTSVLAV